MTPPLYSIVQAFQPGRRCQGHCAGGTVCEEHPDRPWEHDGCGAAGMPCENAACEFDAVTLAARRQASR
jgi:hypothetical protein